MSLHTLMRNAARFIARRRIVLSSLLFVAVAVHDLAKGARPRDIFDIHDPLGCGGGLLIVLGLVLRSWAGGILHKGAELTTTGPYRLIRNPLYVGSFLMMSGFCAVIAESARWRGSQWLRHREYRAIGAALVALAALQLWRLHE